tara:strand:- start:902 stop:1231 length:330 start_codon:yes stop_codon:yes gene_type:complete
MNTSNLSNNKNNDNSIFTKDILIIFMMIISMITNMVFNYLMFYNLNNIEKNDNIDNSKAIDIYQSKMNFENEIKIMKMNEGYLNEQINTLESIVKESINQKQICFGLCW